MARPAVEAIEFEHKGIGTILAQNRLAVPLNQREYSWESEHVDELLMDFSNAINSDKRSYFLGTIVLTSGAGDTPQVSDGQQRLATTTILIAAIRDYFFRKGDTVRSAPLEQEFLLKTDLETTDILPQLTLNVDDNDFFRKFILSSPDSADRNIEPTKESHFRIKSAAEITLSFIEEKVIEPYRKSESIIISRLVEWINFLRKYAQVILLRVPDDLDAFLMFETLNDRGLKASQADLLKNHILSYSGDRVGEAQQQWAEMIGVLESLDRDDITVTYLHHFLITKYGPLKEREIFNKVKELVNSQARSIEFLADIVDGVNHYAALFNSDHKKWGKYGTLTRKNIATMNRDIRVKQIVPLMFAVAKHFSINQEAKLAFRMFVFWSVRFLVVGGRGGLLETNYAQRAKEVADRTITTALQLREAMGDVIPSDAMFEKEFANVRISQNFRARYYLRALEQTKKDDPSPEFVPSDEENVIDLEHILPKNPEDKWPNIDTETAGAYYKRLGNMLIMQAKKNSLIGNSSFADKKKVLKESGFLLTAEVAENKNWGVDEITNRQKKLAKLAIETWPIFPKT